MKKQLFIALLASTVMITSISMTAFATTSTTTTSANSSTSTSTAITTNTAITSTDAAVTATNSVITDSNAKSEAQAPTVVAPIKLSLDGAYKKMLADSPQATIAKWTKDSETSVAKGTSERLSNLNKTEKLATKPESEIKTEAERAEKLAAGWALDTSNKAMLQANRTFVYKQIPKNYDATMNKLKYDTYEMYYNYKYTEAQVQVAKDNLDRTKKIYDSTMLKYKLGTVSKLDTLNAETTLNTAKDSYALAVNGFEQMKMNFNLFMGYNIHQKVTLTDSLTALAFPKKTVDTSIKEALTSRNEISGANYNAEMAEFALNNVKAYPKSSSTYLSAKSTLLMAQEAQKTAPAKVEIDVRTKYMDMKQKYDAVNSGKVSYENSKEASRLGQLQYESGVITVTDLSGINLNTFKTQQDYNKSLLDYNLAVEAYKLASGIGTETVGIK